MVLWYRLAEVRRDASSTVVTVTAWGLLSVTAFVLVAVAARVWTNGAYGRAATFLIIAAGCVVAMVAWRRSLRRELERLERARLELPPMCPACRYELAGLPVDQDRCVVCPECGGAWRAA
jgi:Flp pilus assembly protein TadB